MGLWDRQVDWKERDEGTGKYIGDSVHKEKKSKNNIIGRPPITEEFECIFCGMKNLKYIDSDEEKCTFCKRNKDDSWLKISYSISYQFTTIPNELELDEKVNEILRVFIEKFQMSQMFNLNIKGINQPYMMLDEGQFLPYGFVNKNENIPDHAFEVEVKKTEDEQDYEFIITPKDTYSLQEYYFDGYTLFKTEEELCKLFGISTVHNKLLHMNYDENNNPVIQHDESLIRIQYPMKNRIKFAIKDIKMDTHCFGEPLFILMSRLDKENINNQFEYDKIWLEKVNILINEELKRQGKTRKDFKTKLGLMDKILKHKC